MEEFEAIMRRGGAAAIQEAGRFFMGTDKVHDALRRITGKLGELGIPYAVAGGMALVAHGYDRTTVDVDVLLTEDGLRAAHRALDGLGYVPPFQGSKNLRDTANGVRIEFLIAGQYPGDGKPKPVAFPDPVGAAVEINGIRFLALSKLIELKLASGMTAAHRLKDLADVQELIRELDLPKEFAQQIDPYVRGKFDELWEAVSNSPPDQ